MAFSYLWSFSWVLAEQKTCQQSEEIPSNPWNGDIKGGHEEARLRSGNTAAMLKLLTSWWSQQAGWCGGRNMGFESDWLGFKSWPCRVTWASLITSLSLDFFLYNNKDANVNYLSGFFQTKMKEGLLKHPTQSLAHSRGSVNGAIVSGLLE